MRHTDIAITIRQGLAERYPDYYLSDLAGSLNNKSGMLYSLGRLDEAIEFGMRALSAAERVLFHRGSNEWAIRRDVAMAQTTYSILLYAAGRNSDALQLSIDAVKGYRRLPSETGPETLLGYIASLNNCTLCLRAAARYAEAIELATEAIRICEPHAAQSPDVYLPHYVDSLCNYSGVLADSGRPEDAVDAAERVLAHAKALNNRNSQVFGPTFSGLLNNLCCLYNQLRRIDSAISAGEESAAVRRRLANDRPKIFNLRLAETLINVSISYRLGGRTDDAVCAAQCAHRTAMSVIDTQRGPAMPIILNACGVLGMAYSAACDHARAVRAYESGLEFARAENFATQGAVIPILNELRVRANEEAAKLKIIYRVMQC